MSARFEPGDAVRIHDRNPGLHNRVPVYARGRTGIVEQLIGEYGQPESLGYGGDGKPRQMVYQVHLRQADLWPDYQGQPQDILEIEIFEHWLDPA